MEIAAWKGLANTVAPERLRPGQLVAAKDIDIDDASAIRTRVGQTQVSGTSSHSMWSMPGLCLVAQANALKRMSEAGALTTLATLASSGPISYAELGGVVYFSNGVDTGRVIGGAVREWGVRNPLGQPAAVRTAGGLPAGTYTYAMTFLRDDGQESGTPTPAQLTLVTSSGIILSPLPTTTDTSVIGRMLYISGPNGSELYHAASIPLSATSYSYLNSGVALGRPLDPDYVEPAPAGTIVEVHAGTAYVADGSVVWYSDQYQLERFRRRAHFLQFPGPVSLLVSVDTGLFVATDRATWFLKGTHGPSLQSVLVQSFGAIPGTAVKTEAQELVGEDEPPSPTQPVAVWSSENGVIMGFSSGQVRNMTEAHHGFPGAQRGAGLVRAARGYTTYVASLQGTGSAANSY